MCWKKKYVQNHLHNTFKNHRYRWGSLRFHPLCLLYFSWQKRSKLKLQARFGYPDGSHICHVSHGCHISVIVLHVNSMKWLEWMKTSEREKLVDFLYIFEFIRSLPIIRFDYPRIIRLIWTNSYLNNEQ